MTSLAQWLGSALTAGSVTALPVAFIGGVAMGLNPCCLALYPAAAASCCAGACAEPDAPGRASFLEAALFVVGSALAVTALGMLAAAAGITMRGLGGWPRYVLALVPVLMGLQLLGILRLPMPQAIRGVARRGGLGALATGMLVSLVVTPCGTPALAAILSYAAFSGSLAFGGVLLFFYGVGNGLPLVIVGAGSGLLARRLATARWRSVVERGARTVMLGLGAYLLWAA